MKERSSIIRLGLSAAAHSNGLETVFGRCGAALWSISPAHIVLLFVHLPQEQITDETVELLQPYFAAPDFNFDSAKKASGNVAGLCNWAEAMCTYHEVAKVVEPKIATLREAEAELKIATKVGGAIGHTFRLYAITPSCDVCGGFPLSLHHAGVTCTVKPL